MFRHIISLGYNCAPAYQIRLHKRLDESHFFDWLYTSAVAATQLISRDFKDFMQKGDLQVTRNETEVLDSGSGIRFNHSFKEGGRTSQALIDRDHEQESAKFSFLAERFRTACKSGDPIAFIRYNPPNARLDGAHHLVAMEAALHKYVANPDFKLMWITSGDSAAAPQPISSRTTRYHIVEDPSRSTSHRGGSFTNSDDIAWGELLALVDFDPQGRKLLADGAPVLAP